jgi:translocation and assembly module TamB
MTGIGKVRDLPPMPADVYGSLGKDHFSWSRAEIDLFQGHASVNGSVTWAPKDTWTVSGHLMGIDPSYFRPDLPGKLDFTLAVAAQSFEPTGDITLDFTDFGGRLRGAAASGGGKLSHSGNTWAFENVRVGLGHTNIALDGRIDNQANSAPVDLHFSVTAEDLSLLAADSRGQLKASGTIRGTLADPVVAATAHGTGIHHEGIGLEHIDADIDFDAQPEHES